MNVYGAQYATLQGILPPTDVPQLFHHQQQIESFGLSRFLFFGTSTYDTERKEVTSDFCHLATYFLFGECLYD